jgi:hypothetical protein
MRDRDGWDSLAEYVEYVGPVDTLSTYDLECKLVEHVLHYTG